MCTHVAQGLQNSSLIVAPPRVMLVTAMIALSTSSTVMTLKGGSDYSSSILSPANQFSFVTSISRHVLSSVCNYHGRRVVSNIAPLHSPVNYNKGAIVYY